MMARPDLDLQVVITRFPQQITQPRQAGASPFLD